MVYRESYKVQSRDRAVSFHDVTDRVREIAKKSGIQNGIVVVYTHHTTCSVITQEKRHRYVHDWTGRAAAGSGQCV